MVRCFFTSVIYVSFVTGSKYPLKDIFNLSEDTEIAEENYLWTLKTQRKWQIHSNAVNVQKTAWGIKAVA